MKIYDVRGFGAVGDGKTLDTEAIQQAIDTCAGDGGGRVVLSGPFVYRANTLFLKSNVEFRVETETVLKCGDDRFAFPHDCFLYAENQENIVLSGDGVTDLDLSTALAFHREHEALATMVLTRVDNPLEYGVVVTNIYSYSSDVLWSVTNRQNGTVDVYTYGSDDVEKEAELIAIGSWK